MTLIDLRDEARAHVPVLPDAPEIHAAAIPTWRGRMQNEHGSRRVFVALAEQLARAALPGEETCREFAKEERLHGVLCGAVVEALGGEATFDEEDMLVPRHEEVSPVEGALRNVMSVSCLSETVAVSLIAAERLEMTEGPLRDLLSRILADEIGHARFGWKLLASEVGRADNDLRARLATYLGVAFAHLESHELSHISPDPLLVENGRLLGLCDGPGARRLFYETVSGVIVPGLAGIGLDAERAWADRFRAPAQRGPLDLSATPQSSPAQLRV